MKKIIILVVVIVILAAGYFVLKTKNPSFQIPSFTGGDDNKNTVIEDSDLNLVTSQDIIDEVDNLGSVDIDSELKDIDADLNNL
mgnify:FL=1